MRARLLVSGQASWNFTSGNPLSRQGKKGAIALYENAMIVSYLQLGVSKEHFWVVTDNSPGFITCFKQVYKHETYFRVHFGVYVMQSTIPMTSHTTLATS